MIKNSFILLDGVGEKTERKLWRNGILTWEDFLSSEKVLDIEPTRKSIYDEFLNKASEALILKDSEFFCKYLKKREHWRLFKDFSEECLCLDIETNGLTPEKGGYITVVGIYSIRGYTALIRGENLSDRILQELIDNHKYLITFYGSIFDIPFLKKQFPNLRIEHLPHFDLFFATKRAGISGGLKKLEKTFLINRQKEIEELNGYDAVKLWRDYLDGSKEAIEVLLCYNKADTESLFLLSHIFYNKLKDLTGIKEFLINE
ncbi:MAG: ribonuclease H-like domain-containing protein [Thermodesulfovibrio sp.]|nr:ribonuclease H-like domain-containing protein [Thermodesulfovibrio sp.]